MASHNRPSNKDCSIVANLPTGRMSRCTGDVAGVELGDPGLSCVCLTNDVGIRISRACIADRKSKSDPAGLGDSLHSIEQAAWNIGTL
jgi:hypothetical protein